MKRCDLSLMVLLLSLSPSVVADEFSVAIGLFNFAQDGRDLRVSYRPDASHWQYGLRYVQWSDTFYDPFTGNAHSKTTDKLAGPGVNYLFRDEARHSAYIGISLLKWTRIETPLLILAPSGSASTTDLYFGGGYQGRFGVAGYYNAGMYIAPTAELKSESAISATDQSGNLDIQIQIGLAW